MTAPPAPRTGRGGIRMQAGTVDIDVLDEIDPLYGVSAAAVLRTLRDNPGSPVHVTINSPGGDAFEGLALYESLRQHSGRVTVEVVGLAASAASIVAMAGDEIIMARGAMLMIHDAHSMAWGNAADLREVADLLDKVSDSLAGIYAARAGGNPADWRKAMRGEAWYSATEAVEAGLADRVATPRPAQDPVARARRAAAVRAYAPNVSSLVRAALSSALSPRPPRVRARHVVPSAMPVIRALRARGVRPRGIVR